MKILVTGGAGFIGSNFLRLMVPRYPEHDFVNVDALTYAANLANLATIEDQKNYRFERVDITERSQVQAIFEKESPQTVIHFAAESHVDRSILGPEAFIRTNITGTFNLLESFRSLARDKQHLFHHVSTDEVYGSLGAEGLFREDTPYDPSSPYSASKAASDHLVRAYHRTFEVPIKVTNCSNNYGPFQFPEKLIPVIILNARDGKSLPVYGQGLNVRDWLYVEDHCEAIWAVIEKGKLGETYNIGGNNEVRNIDVVKRICALVAAALGKDEQEVLSQITFVTDRPGHDLRYAIDAAKIKRECGWEPKESFETGLDKTVTWYLEHEGWVEQVRSGDYLKWMEQNYGDRSVSAAAPEAKTGAKP